MAREIGDLYAIAQALTGLGQVAHLEGNHHTAIDLLRDAMRGSEASGDRVGAVGCLDVVAEVATVLGDACHAAWCIGAVDGVLERHGQSRFEAAPGEHQTRVDAVIAALGEPAYRQAWAAGHALDTDAVLGQALRWQPPGPTAGSAEAREATSPEGRERLSPRELEVLRLLVEGNTDREIADALSISRRTVTSHTTNIFTKLGVTNRVQAATAAIRGDLA